MGTELSTNVSVIAALIRWAKRRLRISVIDRDAARSAEDAQAVRTQAATLALATKEAASLAVQERRLAQAGYESKLLTPQQMQAINQAAIITSEKGLAFITFAETVTTDASLRVTAAELLTVFDGMIASLANAGQSGAAIRTALAALIAYLGVTP